jgi:siderophore synthetase component
MEENSNVNSNQCLYKTMEALKANRLQVTTHNQMKSLSEYTKLTDVNNMLRSFDMENNNENLETQEDNPLG